MEVLVVEDSPIYSKTVSELASKNGHQVHTATTIAEANEIIDSASIDLVVLDLVLPDGDGIDFCINLRSRSNAYVLMLTARDDEFDKVTGLRVGADDYVAKPCSPRELEARIQAIARRVNRSELPAEDASKILKHGPITLDHGQRSVVANDQHLSLTKVEFDLLALLLQRPSQVLTRSQILDAVWGYDWYGDDHILDVHIANLRRKLRDHGCDQLIRTVRGVGYGLRSGST